MLRGDIALMTIFKDDIAKVCICYNCHSIRGYFKGEWPKGIWVDVMFQGEPCVQCRSREIVMMQRNDGCIALVEERG